jgi:hypothetical protein
MPSSREAGLRAGRSKASQTRLCALFDVVINRRAHYHESGNFDQPILKHNPPLFPP